MGLTNIVTMILDYHHGTSFIQDCQKMYDYTRNNDFENASRYLKKVLHHGNELRKIRMNHGYLEECRKVDMCIMVVESYTLLKLGRIDELEYRKRIGSVIDNYNGKIIENMAFKILDPE